jgi:hypothetical protein
MDNTCPRCGSTKIIPDLPICVMVQTDVGVRLVDADVQVQGAPQAWIFKNPVPGLLRVKICGECGHAELHAGNFRGLYEAYEQSRQS